jgi:hypothetical protein
MDPGAQACRRSRSGAQQRALLDEGIFEYFDALTAAKADGPDEE